MLGRSVAPTFNSLYYLSSAFAAFTFCQKFMWRNIKDSPPPPPHPKLCSFLFFLEHDDWTTRASIFFTFVFPSPTTFYTILVVNLHLIVLCIHPFEMAIIYGYM
jgi:hypothetical protein